jgi:hypothetical protein
MRSDEPQSACVRNEGGRRVAAFETMNLHPPLGLRFQLGLNWNLVVTGALLPRLMRTPIV